jgi:general stress protein CsbA
MEKPEFISDMAFGYSIGIFGFILFVQNIFTAISHRKKVHLNSAYFVSCLMILIWFEDIEFNPYGAICCMIISVIIIFSKFYIDNFLTKYLVE